MARYLRRGRSHSFAFIGWGWIKLFLICIPLAALSVALQTTVLSHIDLPFLSPAAPSLTLLWVIAMGLFVGEKEGAVMGLICGILADAAAGETWMLLPVVYTLCGYLVGILSKDRLARNLPSYAVWVLVGGIWEQVTLYVRYMIRIGGLPSSRMISEELLPRLLLTLALVWAVYPAAICIKKIFVRK